MSFVAGELSSKTWRITFVDATDNFDQHNATSIVVNSCIICATEALKLKWPNAFCYNESFRVCLLSDVILSPVERTSEDQKSCMTNFMKVDGKELFDHFS